MRATVEAILFDVDGTLVDSTGAVERAWTTWAGRHRLDPEAILAVCHGRRSQDTIAEFLPADEVPPAVDELAALELADLGDVVALPGAAAVLEGLPRHRWAAVTSGSRRLMAARMSAAGLPVPEVLVAAEDVTDGKPDPEGYRKAADSLGFPIERCLVVEDAPAGILAGRAAGAVVLAVSTSHDRSTLTGADAIVTDLTAASFEPAGDGLVVAVDVD